MLCRPGKWFAAALLAVGVAACDESPVTLPEPTSIPATAAEIKLTVGDAATLPNQVLDQQGQVIRGAQPSFTSDNPSVASVDATGTVRAMSKGTANITAAYGGITAISKVTVAARPGTTPTAIAMPTGELRLTVGDAVALPGQVLNESGQVMEGLRPSFSSSNPSVVSVDASGAVRALSTGTADITARYGTLTSTVKVTVSNDLRSFVRSLDVLADSVAADVRVGASAAVAIRAFNGFGQPVCPTVTVQVDDPSVAVVSQVGCRLVVTPRFQGRTTVRVSADDVSDTFVVNVTSTGMNALFSSRPAASALFAGNTVSYGVRLLNEQGNGIAGRKVAFDVSAGTLSASSATTDAAGYATVQWTLPTNLRELGSAQSIAFSTTLPNGAVVQRNETVFINGAALASLTLLRQTPQGWQPITTPSITAPAYQYIFLGARGEDQYGNPRVEDFSLTMPGTSKFGDYQTSDGIEYAEFYTSAPKTTTFTVTGGGMSKSVQVVIQ
jgi:hypothetical protein